MMKSDNGYKDLAHSVSSQLGQLLHAFNAQIDALEPQMAQAVAQAAVMLARRVVRAEIHTRPEHVAEVATQAVNAVLQSARHIRVLVHPQSLVHSVVDFPLRTLSLMSASASLAALAVVLGAAALREKPRSPRSFEMHSPESADHAPA